MVHVTASMVHVTNLTPGSDATLPTARSPIRCGALPRARRFHSSRNNEKTHFRFVVRGAALARGGTGAGTPTTPSRDRRRARARGGERRAPEAPGRRGVSPSLGSACFKWLGFCDAPFFLSELDERRVKVPRKIDSDKTPFTSSRAPLRAERPQSYNVRGHRYSSRLRRTVVAQLPARQGAGSARLPSLQIEQRRCRGCPPTLILVPIVVAASRPLPGVGNRRRRRRRRGDDDGVRPLAPAPGSAPPRQLRRSRSLSSPPRRTRRHASPKLPKRRHRLRCPPGRS
jgi:hypothetical protein